MWGKHIKISLFGESHGPAIGITIEGLPSGVKLDQDLIDKEMKKRAPGKSPLTTARQESDRPKIISGYFNGRTTGAPLTAIIENNDTRSRDYESTKWLMRPGHADYTIHMKTNGFNDYRGGGHSSGRITAPLVFAGSIAKQMLAKKGIYIGAHIVQIGQVKGRKFHEEELNKETFDALGEGELPVVEKDVIEKMRDEILTVKKIGDSVGGMVECAIVGLPVGLGSPFFDSVESTLSHLLFSVPAVKGVAFGAGFDFALMRGSQANDAFYYCGDVVKTVTNHNGGILGGLTTGMPVVFACAIKPTPSISMMQSTVDIKEGVEKPLEITGRHDPCIVPRIVPVVEAVAGIGVLDLVLGSKAMQLY